MFDHLPESNIKGAAQAADSPSNKTGALKSAFRMWGYIQKQDIEQFFLSRFPSQVDKDEGISIFFSFAHPEQKNSK